jgi:hypothetical protein
MELFYIVIMDVYYFNNFVKSEFMIKVPNQHLLWPAIVFITPGHAEKKGS